MATHAQALPASISPLRRVLQANAAACFVSGVALVAAAVPIATLTGAFSPLAIAIIGALCLVAAALCWRVAQSQPLNRRGAWAIAIIDADWVIASAAVLFTGWLPLTETGWWLVLAQALVVDLFAMMQLWLLWKSR
ncbi:MAG: hypothetical protein H7Y32_05115 [Chloroflexales bacterium]|nr:hypothetical protein [Chloroflexales bacterium]